MKTDLSSSRFLLIAIQNSPLTVTLVTVTQYIAIWLHWHFSKFLIGLSYTKKCLDTVTQYTECFFCSVARFGWWLFAKFHRPVGWYSSYLLPMQANGTFQNVIFQTLRQSRKNTLYRHEKKGLLGFDIGSTPADFRKDLHGNTLTGYKAYFSALYNRELYYHPHNFNN